MRLLLFLLLAGMLLFLFWDAAKDSYNSAITTEDEIYRHAYRPIKDVQSTLVTDDDRDEMADDSIRYAGEIFRFDLDRERQRGLKKSKKAGKTHDREGMRIYRNDSKGGKHYYYDPRPFHGGLGKREKSMKKLGKGKGRKKGKKGKSQKSNLRKWKGVASKSADCPTKPGPTLPPMLLPTQPPAQPTLAPFFPGPGPPSTLAPSPTPAPIIPTLPPTLPPVPTEAPTAGKPTFLCGAQPTSDIIDIVLVVDELVGTQAQIIALQSTITAFFGFASFRTNGNFRFALVGMGGPANGSDQSDPVLESVLTNDGVAFQSAADALTSNKSPFANGYGTLQLIATNQVPDAAGNVVPLAGNEQFPSSRGMCAIVIASVDSLGYQDFPNPGPNAVIDEFAKTGSVIFAIGRENSQYQALTTATGGRMANINAFKASPIPIATSFVDSCVTQLCSGEEALAAA